MSNLPLADWHDFYLMIGGASGVIVGATFIVASLVSEMKESATIGMRGFITPIAVHLGSVLVGSAILTAPTLTPLSLGILLGAGGVAGVIYGIVVAARIWSMELGLDDRICYALLPILCYAAIAAAALMEYWAVDRALEMLAVAIVVLLIIGMRNAWDMATFMIMRRRGEGG